MNILVTTLGSYGDIYPMAGLAVRLKQRGHRVTFLTNPFFEGCLDRLLDKVSKSGAESLSWLEKKQLEAISKRRNARDRRR